ncbi:tRNA preQ1(34) S-adenosylmethionine ribosyltransferase-isomerase QueA [Hydrogenimonas sp.]
MDPLKTESYDYDLPKELIATEAAEPRDSARLLVVDRAAGRIEHARFRDILNYLPSGTAVVHNDTRVIKARLFGHKSSGGKVELLLDSPLPRDRFVALIRGRVKPGSRLYFGEGLEAEVVALHDDGSRTVAFYGGGEPLDFAALLPYLERLGRVPLPPYMNREDRTEDVERYQSVFARKAGAVAAPTASLHFTPALWRRLQERHDTCSVTLHVGAGTFKPVESETITDHPMHSEYYEIPETTRRCLESGHEILAIGTTVARTVEYYARTREPRGACDLFLHPGNPPIRVDHLLTNFHLPKSTLIMLVAAFLGLEETMRVYNMAIEARYRFYSYGDAMLIL